MKTYTIEFVDTLTKSLQVKAELVEVCGEQDARYFNLSDDTGRTVAAIPYYRVSSITASQSDACD